MNDERRSGNPSLGYGAWEAGADETYVGEPMTLSGTVAKTGILFAILLATAVFGWIKPTHFLLLAGGIGGFVVALATCFKPKWAPVTAPLYAALEGLFLGAISVLYASAYKGIVPQAALLTGGVFLAMYLLYSTGVIKVTTTFRMAVMGATIGVMICYLGTWIIGMFTSEIYKLPMYQPGTIGIIFSLFVIGIAAMNLALDFQFVRDGVENRAPKYMEWYAGFGLMVTLVWIYLEMLRLLRKTRG